MTAPIVRAAAAADVEDAYRWYEAQRAGLGDDFLRALRRTVDSVCSSPKRHAVLHRQTRRALVPRFPYAVFYRIMGESIVIVACLHGRRDPRIWRGRR